MKEELTYHIPVLLLPSVNGMNIRPDGTYVDVTFGGARPIPAKFCRDWVMEVDYWDLTKMKMRNEIL